MVETWLWKDAKEDTMDAVLDEAQKTMLHELVTALRCCPTSAETETQATRLLNSCTEIIEASPAAGIAAVNQLRQLGCCTLLIRSLEEVSCAVEGDERAALHDSLQAFSELCLDLDPSFATVTSASFLTSSEDSPHVVAAVELGGQSLLLRRRAATDSSGRVEKSLSNMVWGSSLVLLNEVATRMETIFYPNDRCVLEIGAGLGVAGIGAALLLQRSKVFSHIEFLITDGAPGALKTLDDNIGLNEAVRKLCTAGALDWDAPILACNEQHFDVILGADVLHERSHAIGIHRVIRHALKRAPGARAIIVNPAAQHRFGVTEFEEKIAGDSELTMSSTALKPPKYLESADAFDLHVVQWKEDKQRPEIGYD